MPSQESHFAALQFTHDERIRRLAEGRLHALLAHIGEPGHGVQAAAPDDADLCRLQVPRSCADRAAFAEVPAQASWLVPGRSTRKSISLRAQPCVRPYRRVGLATILH